MARLRSWVICGAVGVGLCAGAGEKELTLTWNAAPLGDASPTLRLVWRCMPRPSVPALRNAGPCCAPPATQRDGGAAAAAGSGRVDLLFR